MQPESLVREPVSGRRLLARACLGGLLLATILWFAWWQLLEKVWADSQTANSVQEGPLIIGYSPLVFLSAFFAFAIPTVVFGRRRPRTAAIVGLTLAVFVTYQWFALVLPGADAVLFSGLPSWLMLR
jgi:hypothetical protein